VKHSVISNIISRPTLSSAAG